MTSDPYRLDGISLHTYGWRMDALQVGDAHSSYFADETRFPRGSVRIDCALIMRDLAHEWHTAQDLLLNEKTCGV